jgi:hypothetical protein
VTRPTTRPGLAAEFAADLTTSVAYAVEHRGEDTASGALYGFSGMPGGQEVLQALLTGAIDAMYGLPTQTLPTRTTPPPTEHTDG